MSPRQRALFESVAGSLLDELGYPVEGVGRKLSASEVGWWETGHQLRLLALRLWKLRIPEFRRNALSFGGAAMRGLVLRGLQPSRRRPKKSAT
jgi:hypothetical protein